MVWNNRGSGKVMTPEGLVKYQITQYLNSLQNAKQLAHYHIQQGFGSRPGLPDKFVLLPGGRTVWIEVKSLTGKMSTAQVVFRDTCDILGHFYIIARDVNQFIEEFDRIMGER